MEGSSPEFAILPWIACAIAALLAGFVNSIAGGGTLLTFPSLQFALGAVFPGLPGKDILVMANTTSTLAVLPGSLAGAWGVKNHLVGARNWLVLLIPSSIVGGCLGAFLLTRFPSQFSALVPWLLFLASTLFLVQPWISKLTQKPESSKTTSPWGAITLAFFQLFVATYGGYFGAGIGILMIASLSLMGIHDLNRVNGIKNILAFLINTTAALFFCFNAPVHWPLAIWMAIFSVLGGYMGGVLGQRIPRKVLRAIIIVIGYGLSMFYFIGPQQ